ncbi:hypothetical protein GCM10017674_59410 [Streptomyces gardneri]|uniref:Uncharacterized protein n=1 Tax=Streptomyces gardneri TaxID=66892 RepID=A0A4Y3RKY6_9ACTN|nr:hypothetical protein SGA01_29820 [Streptomyces gardneri]GHH12895.1 hypothetical protein GCM10017674_59410 [Streptomyces gardneri]
MRQPLSSRRGTASLVTEREPGQCRQCGQDLHGAEDPREETLASARAKVDRLRLDLGDLQRTPTTAGKAADAAEEAAAQALALRDSYEPDHLAPARQAAQRAEKKAFGLSGGVSLSGGTAADVHHLA